MFKKLFSAFAKKEKLASITAQPAADTVTPPAAPLADIIEVPWKECAAVKNYEDSITQLHHEMKEFLYKVKMKEISAIKAIERLEMASDDKIESIKVEYLGDQKDNYEFTVSSGTGKPGFLKKKKTNK